MDPKKAMDRVFTSMRGSKSVRDFQEDQRDFPNGAINYELLQECGQGVSATVWKALCRPLGEIVGVKLLDLESMNCRMEEVIREAQTMRMFHHPNVLSLHTCFLEGQQLWFVMPYIRGGSVLNIMKYRYKDGLDELVIAIIMKEVAKALEYVHKGGGIHRDVKAGNILIGDDASVKLADFGVAATVERGGSWGNSLVNRNTFVGTPCWMAPEVMEQMEGYDSKADIWSFGITLLELAHGHAPFAKFPPMKVLLMTLQNPPPQLEVHSGHREFSKHMRELVANCLQKDPAQRPSASQILESRFFRTIPDTKYLLTHLLQDLPPLTDRVRISTDGALSNPAQEAIQTKEEYVRGMSGWDFTGISASAELSPVRENHAPKQEPIPETAPVHNSGVSPRQSEATDEGFFPPSTSETPSTAGDRPLSPDSLTSPTNRKTASVNSSAAARALAPSDRNGSGRKQTGAKSSRFTVFVADDGKGSERQKSALNTSRTSDSAAASVKSDDGNQMEDDDPKKIGRFDVEVKKVKLEKKAQKSGSSSASELNKMGSTKGSSFVPPATVLKNRLIDMLDSITGQQLELQKTVDALKEADKGKVQPLQTLLAGNSFKREDRILELEKKLRDLETENKSLKEQNVQLEQLLASGGTSNGPTPKSVEDS
ncbi:hypothetical protein BSKO_00387 [Bryopsis sp. KO-2023]|nr:hypothetical protein BSKO_00387 [Bryopsis sp. KO-2023]